MASFLPLEILYLLVVGLPMALWDLLKALIVFLVVPRFLRSKKDIQNKIVLVTGAGSGLGRQLAVEFSKQATCLVLLDLDKASLFDTEKLLDRRARTFVFQCDVSDRERVYEVARMVKEEVGIVDILVNNAGVVCGKVLTELPDEQIVKTVGVNLMAHFWTCKAFLPDMLERDSGHVVCVASVAGLQGSPKLVDYCASKFGVVGFMESLALELDSLGKTGVKTTTICPSLINTGLFAGARPPLSVSLSPEFVAREVVSAVLEDRDFLLLPEWTGLVMPLKWTMPSSTMRRFFDDSGLLRCMDTFQGRTTDNKKADSQK